MKRKFVAIMMAFGIMSSLFGANYASAETKSETKTFSGNVVKSTLKCTWSARGNDKATAITSWKGMSGHRVEVRLYYAKYICQEYIKSDTDYGDKTAITMEERTSVYKYYSVHSVRNKSTKALTTKAELSDW